MNLGVVRHGNISCWSKLASIETAYVVVVAKITLT